MQKRRSAQALFSKNIGQSQSFLPCDFFPLFLKELMNHKYSTLLAFPGLLQPFLGLMGFIFAISV
jgi:hypothetical protein